jgi:RNA polymerase sigma-54 factor
MELNFRNDLNTELSQRLALTPEMIQSLNILQYSRGELVDYMYDIMMENPVIEFEEPDFSAQPVVEADSVDSYDDEYSDRFEWDAGEWSDYAESMGYDDENYYGRYSYDTQDSDRYDYSVSDAVTLEENLLEQVEMTDAPYLIRAIASYIVQTLDDNGYMTCSIQDIADELNVSADKVQEALELVWTFDPPGVGARDLAECMELQLRAIGRYTDEFGVILRDHLEDIAMNRLSAAAKATGLSVYDIQDYADTIRSLEPKPGRMFAAAESTNFIIPDVTVSNENGKFTVSINSNSTPKVIIRNEYRNMLRDAEKNSGVAAFLSNRFNTAMWLIRSIEQRNETITRVTEAIVKRQHEFFVSGRGNLKPMTMKEVADEVGVHESTVSRAVNGKYMQSPQGVYELRYFFTGTSRFSGANGESASAESLKVMISSIVESEDRTKPLSDRSIAEAITVTGIQISRRTVAKYREELGIPSSSIRRRVK